MCCEKWKLIGLCALALGTAIVVVAVVPVCFLMIVAALLLIACGVMLLKKR